MDNSTFRQLIEKYLTNTLDAGELAQLKILLQDPQNVQLLDQVMEQQLEESTVTPQDYPLVTNRISEQLQLAIGKVDNKVAIRNTHTIRTIWFRAAAAIILLIGAGAYLWFHFRNKPVNLATIHPAAALKDVAPGHDGAVLTLADGTNMVLDSMQDGVVANQQGVKAVLKNGQLVYEAADLLSDNIIYNTMTTPRGRQFHLTLPDGTLVWLNASSSITYPTSFIRNQRNVTITGEAYFEVVKNKAQPFIVSFNGQQVEVLGTTFNINTYSDEGPGRTTLVEGSIRLRHDDKSIVLHPGEQAVIEKDITINKTPDMEQVLAWKNGLFYFDNANVEEVMRQLARWYEIEVVYEKGMPDVRFSGKMLRNLNLSQVINILNKMQVQCRLEAGNKLIINKS